MPKFGTLSELDINTEPSQTEAKQSIFQRLKEIATMSEILRMFGACAVITSMSLFMLEGWAEGNDIQRYLKLLGQTGLLTAAGLCLSFILKEYKGARLFFGLSLTSIVANFTILGALIYSMFQLDGGLQQYPVMATWVEVNSSTFWPLCVGAIALLAVLARFSYSIFARNIAGSLSVSFLLLNGLLLVPVRSSVAISALLIISLFAAGLAVKHLLKTKDIVFTTEAKFAIGTLFIPGTIIAARAISLYHLDEILVLTLAGLGYFALRCLDTLIVDGTAKRIGQVAQCGLGFNIATQVSALIPHTLANIVPAVFSGILLVSCLDQVQRSKDVKWNSFIFNLSGFVLVIANVAIAVFDSSLSMQIGSLLVSLTVLLATKMITNARATQSAVIAALGVVVSAGIIIFNLITLAHLSSWVLFGAIGMLLILGASAYERYGYKLISKA